MPEYPSSKAQAFFLYGLLSRRGGFLLGKSPQSAGQRAPVSRTVTEIASFEHSDAPWKAVLFSTGTQQEIEHWFDASLACGLLGEDPAKLVMFSDEVRPEEEALLAEMGIELTTYASIAETPFVTDGWGTYGNAGTRRSQVVLGKKAFDTPYARAFTDEEIAFAYINAFLGPPDGMVPASRQKRAWADLRSFALDLSYGMLCLPSLAGWDWSFSIPQEKAHILTMIPPGTGPLSWELSETFLAYRAIRSAWMSACKHAGCIPASMKALSKNNLPPVLPEILKPLGEKWGIKAAIAEDMADRSIVDVRGGRSLRKIQREHTIGRTRDLRPVGGHRPAVLTAQSAAVASVAAELHSITASVVSFGQGVELSRQAPPPFVSDSAVYQPDKEKWAAITCPGTSHRDLVGIVAALTGRCPEGTSRLAVLAGDWENVSEQDRRRTRDCLSNDDVEHFCDLTGMFPDVGNSLADVLAVADSQGGDVRWTLADGGKSLSDGDWEALSAPYFSSYIKQAIPRLSIAGEGLLGGWQWRRLLEALSLGRSSATEMPPPIESFSGMGTAEGLFHPVPAAAPRLPWMDTVDELGDLTTIWKEALSERGMLFTLSQNSGGTFSFSREMLEDVSDALGVEGMLDAYYAGIPVEDIVAGA